MDFTHDFTVPQPIEDAWTTILALERVIPLVPYTTVIEGSGSKVTARIAIRFGAVSMTYTGGAEIVERDDQAHRAVMKATARQNGGRSCVAARVEIQLMPNGASTTGRLVSTVNVPALGPQTGMATINRTTEQMIRTFAENIATLSPASPLAA